MSSGLQPPCGVAPSPLPFPAAVFHTVVPDVPLESVPPLSMGAIGVHWLLLQCLLDQVCQLCFVGWVVQELHGKGQGGWSPLLASW